MIFDFNLLGNRGRDRYAKTMLEWNYWAGVVLRPQIIHRKLYIEPMDEVDYQTCTWV